MSQVNAHKLINQGFRQARLITKKCAKTFYFASRFLNKEKRKAAYSVYSICRISDDSVDIPNQSPASTNLETIRKKIDSAYSNDKLDDNVLFSDKSVTSDEGRADLRSGGKYHRVRTHPTGSWTHAVGLDLDYSTHGTR